MATTDEVRGWFDAVSDAYELEWGEPLIAEYASHDFPKQVNQISLMMSGDGDVTSAPGCEKMIVEWIGSFDEYHYGGIEVQHIFDEDGFPALYLGRYLDDKGWTTNREATGNEGAWCVVQALHEAFESVKEKCLHRLPE